MPTPTNGLREISRLMIDKVTTVPNSKLGAHVGQMSDENMLRLNRSLMVFLGLTD
jgi:mRNA interferase MazF